MHTRTMVIVVIVLVISVILIAFLGNQFHASQFPWLTTFTVAPSSSYDPSRYGVPSTINGYKVIAVLAPDNTLCMPEWEKRVVVQATSSDLQSYQDADESNQIIHSLDALDKTTWTIEIVGPGVTFEQFVAENEKGNATAKANGCARLGRPFP